jgi:hypothetical protein
LPATSDLDISSPPRRRCIRGDTATGWGDGRLAWGDLQTVAGEEVRIQIFHEHIITSAQKQACQQHLTLFFCPPPAVDVYERLRGSDRMKVGHGEGGGQCHDGGEGQHEVSTCLVLIKSLVSISKIP